MPVDFNVSLTEHISTNYFTKLEVDMMHEMIIDLMI